MFLDDITYEVTIMSADSWEVCPICNKGEDYDDCDTSVRIDYDYWLEYTGELHYKITGHCHECHTTWEHKTIIQPVKKP